MLSSGSRYHWLEPEEVFVLKDEYQMLLRAAQSLLSRHARSWARPLLQVVYDSISEQGSCFHYLARDLLLLVAEWKCEADEINADDPLPAGLEGDLLLSNLVEKLMVLCVSDQARSVSKEALCARFSANAVAWLLSA